MAILTVRNVDDKLKERLRILAAIHGHSMEEEVRLILKRAAGGMTGRDVWELSRQLFKAENGVELALPTRSKDQAPPDFGIENRREASRRTSKGTRTRVKKVP